MSERRRLRRRDPERTAPRRSSEMPDDPNSFGRWAPEDASPQAPHPDPADSRRRNDGDWDPWRFEARNGRQHADDDPWRRTREPLHGPATEDPATEDPVTAGVRMGYRVIEEHIRQGQRVARQIADHDYRLGDFSDDVWEILHRAIRYSEDLAAHGFELLLSLSRLGPNAFPRHRNFGRHPRGTPWSHSRPESRFSARDDRRPFSFDSEERSPFHRPPHTHRPADAETGFAVELVAEGPVAVNLDLAPGGGHGLEIAELSCAESEASLLEGVSWVVAGPTRKLRLRVTPGQPPGTYVGPLIDLYGRERGWLTVHVGEHRNQPEELAHDDDENNGPITESPFGTD